MDPTFPLQYILINWNKLDLYQENYEKTSDECMVT